MSVSLHKRTDPHKRTNPHKRRHTQAQRHCPRLTSSFLLSSPLPLSSSLRSSPLLSFHSLHFWRVRSSSCVANLQQLPLPSPRLPQTEQAPQHGSVHVY